MTQTRKLNGLYKWLLLVAIGLGIPMPLSAQDEEPPKYIFGGYVKYLQSSSYVPQLNTLITNNLIHNRLNFKWFPGQAWTIGLEARNRLFFGEQVKLTPNFGRQIDPDIGLLDLSVRWVDDDVMVLHSILDRAYIDYTKGDWEVRLGRQRINWGINTVWNPNDLFNAYNFLDFDYEERPGNDALRVTWYPGLTTSAEVAIAPAKEFKETIAAGLFKFNKWNYDFQLLTGYFQGDIAIGGGWAGYIKGAGFKGELTWFTPTEASTDSMNSFNASISGDFQFGNGLYLSGSAFYNYRGVSRAETLVAGLAAQQLSAKNLFPTKWAFYAGLSGQATPLLSLNGGFIYSPNGHLTAFVPTITYSIKENWDIDLIGQSFLSKDSTGYAHQGTTIFLRLKWSY